MAWSSCTLRDQKIYADNFETIVQTLIFGSELQWVADGVSQPNADSVRGLITACMQLDPKERIAMNDVNSRLSEALASMPDKVILSSIQREETEYDCLKRQFNISYWHGVRHYNVRRDKARAAEYFTKAYNLKHGPEIAIETLGPAQTAALRDVARSV